MVNLLQLVPTWHVKRPIISASIIYRLYTIEYMLCILYITVYRQQYNAHNYVCIYVNVYVLFASSIPLFIFIHSTNIY